MNKFALSLLIVLYISCGLAQDARQGGSTGYLATQVNPSYPSWFSAAACNPTSYTPSVSGATLGTTLAEQLNFVDRHNYWRNKLAEGNLPLGGGEQAPAAKNLQAVRNHPDLECMALRYMYLFGENMASTFSLYHSNDTNRNGNNVGENLYMYGAAMSTAYVGWNASDAWWAEINDARVANLTSMTWNSGAPTIGHFTAMAWEGITHIGCSYYMRTGTVVVCNYGRVLNGVAIQYAAPNMLGNPVYSFISGIVQFDSTWPCCSSTVCSGTSNYTRRGSEFNATYPKLCYNPFENNTMYVSSGTAAPTVETPPTPPPPPPTPVAETVSNLQFASNSYLIGNVSAAAGNSWVSGLACDPASLWSTYSSSLSAGTTAGIKRETSDNFVHQLNLIRQGAASGTLTYADGTKMPIATNLPILKRDTNLECNSLRWLLYWQSLNTTSYSGSSHSSYRNGLCVNELAWMYSNCGYYTETNLPASLASSISSRKNYLTANLTKAFTWSDANAGYAWSYALVNWQDATRVGCTLMPHGPTGWIYLLCQFGVPKAGSLPSVSPYYPLKSNTRTYDYDQTATAVSSAWVCGPSTTSLYVTGYTYRGGDPRYPNLCADYQLIIPAQFNFMVLLKQTKFLKK